MQRYVFHFIHTVYQYSLWNKNFYDIITVPVFIKMQTWNAISHTWRWYMGCIQNFKIFCVFTLFSQGFVQYDGNVDIVITFDSNNFSFSYFCDDIFHMMPRKSCKWIMREISRSSPVNVLLYHGSMHHNIYTHNLTGMKNVWHRSNIKLTNDTWYLTTSFNASNVCKVNFEQLPHFMAVDLKVGFHKN